MAARKTQKGQKGTYEVPALIITFLVITLCEIYFVLDAAADMFYLDVPTQWVDHTLLELITTIALAVALAGIGWQIRRLLKAHRSARDSVQVASGELLAVINARFDAWGLSPSEREIALLLIKGLSAQEIADLRATRPGTVKSQSSAIYQKAQVRGRNELVAYFVEDLLAGEDLLNGGRP